MHAGQRAHSQCRALYTSSWDILNQNEETNQLVSWPPHMMTTHHEWVFILLKQPQLCSVHHEHEADLFDHLRGVGCRQERLGRLETSQLCVGTVLCHQDVVVGQLRAQVSLVWNISFIAPRIQLIVQIKILWGEMLKRKATFWLRSR